MSAPEQPYDSRIDRYLKGDLDESARAEVEAQISQDANFAAAVEQRRATLRVIGVAGREALRARFKSLHQQMEPELPLQKRRIWPWLAAAATVLLLLIPLYWFMSAPSPQALFDSHFQPGQDRYFSVLRDQEDLAFARAIRQFKNGNYRESAPYFQQKAEQFPDSLDFRLLNGVTQLGLRKTAQARSEFQFLLAGDRYDYFRAPAEWYAGLNELQAGNLQDAKAHFEFLADKAPPNNYREAAQKLYKAIAD